MNENNWENDKKLIERWQNGDEQAFDEIYKRNKAKVESALIRKLGISREIAEDMFHEAMEILWGKRYVFIVKGLISTYLIQVALYKAIDELRKRGKTVRLEDVDLEDLEKTNFEWDKEELTSDFFVGETEIINPILHEALDLMTKKPCNKILQLYYVYKLKLEEIAKKLGMNDSYIRRRKGECEEHLKEIYEKLKKDNQ